MNPRFTLRGMWFPRNLAGKLRKFWNDFKAGRRPVMLRMSAAARQVAGGDRFHRMGHPDEGPRRSKLAAAARQGVELAD